MAGYYTFNENVANDVGRLVLHCGWSAKIDKLVNIDLFAVYINKSKTEPQINNVQDKNRQEQNERYVKYKGTVYCLEIPDTHRHIYYMRNDNFSLPHWTGNSSRAGQKGICGMTLSDSDMPRTKEGMMPSFIINPHCIPSRMTLGQLYESQIGNWAATKGTQTDGTFFHKIDIESIGNELEDLGLDRCGYHRLYNGMTGEWIDTEIFMGPTFYQRLQKFVVDTIYKVTQGPTDPITYIPVDGGRGTGGGLRLGEMEKDVFISHGNMRCLSEKFFTHSDGTNLYVCKCGKPCIVNLSQNPPILKCKYCGDNADIYKIPTSWSSKLMVHEEIPAMNIGVRTIPEPFVFERSAIEMSDKDR